MVVAYNLQSSVKAALTVQLSLEQKVCTSAPFNSGWSVLNFRCGHYGTPGHGKRKLLCYSLPRLFDEVVFLTKWPLFFPAPNQKAIWIVAEVLVLMFEISESLPSDCRANLLVNVVMDVCSFLGITKLNTTAYHPQCMTLLSGLGKILSTGSPPF